MPLFWRRPPDRPGPENDRWPDLAMREGHWKFYMQYDGSRPRLFNLETDVSESKNLAGEQPDLTEKYRNMLNAWNAAMPKDAGQAE